MAPTGTDDERPTSLKRTRGGGRGARSSPGTTSRRESPAEGSSWSGSGGKNHHRRRSPLENVGVIVRPSTTAPGRSSALKRLGNEGVQRARLLEYSSEAIGEAFYALGASAKLVVSIPDAEVEAFGVDENRASTTRFARTVGPWIRRGVVELVLVGVTPPSGVGADVRWMAALANATRNVADACDAVNASVPVSTAFSLSVLRSSFPPSASLFAAPGPLSPVLAHLHRTHAPFVIDLDPYLAWRNSYYDISLDYALFGLEYDVDNNAFLGDAPDGRVPEFVDGDVQYWNLFDAMVDAVRWALFREGLGDLQLTVGSVGWPSGFAVYSAPAASSLSSSSSSSGNGVHSRTPVATPASPQPKPPPAATAAYAAKFNSRLARHMNCTRSPIPGAAVDPRTGCAPLVAYIFEADDSQASPFPNAEKTSSSDKKKKDNNPAQGDSSSSSSSSEDEEKQTNGQDAGAGDGDDDPQPPSGGAGPAAAEDSEDPTSESVPPPEPSSSGSDRRWAVILKWGIADPQTGRLKYSLRTGEVLNDRPLVRVDDGKCGAPCALKNLFPPSSAFAVAALVALGLGAALLLLALVAKCFGGAKNTLQPSDDLGGSRRRSRPSNSAEDHSRDGADFEVSSSDSRAAASSGATTNGLSASASTDDESGDGSAWGKVSTAVAGALGLFRPARRKKTTFSRHTADTVASIIRTTKHTAAENLRDDRRSRGLWAGNYGTASRTFESRSSYLRAIAESPLQSDADDDLSSDSSNRKYLAGQRARTLSDDALAAHPSSLTPIVL